MASQNGSQPATQADLQAVKVELKADVQAVKADIHRLETRIGGLDATTRKMALELVKTQANVRRVEESMATKADVQRILGAIESLAGKAENYDRVSVIHGHSLVEVEVKLKNHDKRLAALESKK